MTTVAPPPPSPTGPPPQMSPGGRTAFRVVLVAAAALLLTAGLVTFGTLAWGISTFRVVTDAATLPAGMRSLVINTGDVPIAIRVTADRDAREPRASLRLVNTTRSGEHRLMVTNEGDQTRIGVEGSPAPMLKWARGGEITVTLPPDQARRLAVHTEQQAGVVLAQADVDELTVRTTYGPVILSGSARRVEVHTVHGEVTSRAPISVIERFSATTSDGDIVVDFKDEAPATVEATSRNGDVVIGVPETGPYLVQAQSRQSAQIRVRETTDRAAAVADITARSENGDVVIEETR